MELEDLVLQKIYRVEKVLDNLHPITFRMAAIEDPNGNYKSESAKDTENMLTNGRSAGPVFVRMGNGRKWYPMKQH